MVTTIIAKSTKSSKKRHEEKWFKMGRNSVKGAAIGRHRNRKIPKIHILGVRKKSNS